jgi:glycosyltransferase involved in cell wall biosynthesis
MTKSISVIIPHFNQPTFLEKCLQSLAAQSFGRERFEIIVVDNCSKELPQELCDQFNAKLLVEKQPGPGLARNTGIAAASGVLLAFIDADCFAHVDWLKHAVEALLQPNVLVIGGDVRIGYVDENHLTALEAYESVFAYRQKEYIERIGFSGTGNLAFKREAFDKVGPFAGIGIAEDRDWGLRAKAKGLKISYVPGMIVWHPARKQISELKQKWQRHIVHDYAGFRGSAQRKVLWYLRAFAIAASPVRDIFRVMFSDRLHGAGNKFKAIVMLLRIRFYRTVKMMLLPLMGDGADIPQWNDGGKPRGT